MKRTELYKLLQSAGLHSQYLGYEYFADAVWLAAKDPARLHNMRRPASGLLLQCGAGYPHHPGRSLPAYSCRLLPLPRTSAALAAFSALSAGMHRPFRRLPGQASLTCPDFLSYNRVSADSAIPLQEEMSCLRNVIALSTERFVSASVRNFINYL